MPGKSNGNVIGYYYYLGMHMVVCASSDEAPVDALLGITVGGRIFYGGHINTDGTAYFDPTGLTATQDLYLTNDNLFGGDTREGGIQGTIGFKFGESTQAADEYLKKMFNTSTNNYTPAFRGVFSVILKQCYIGINPYLKDWAFLLRRLSCPTWQPSLSKIQMTDGHYDANPAHIIRECIINKGFGMGYDALNIDDDFFSNAAGTLFREGFGLALIWDQQSSVGDFIQKILNHINGVLSVSLLTGKFQLKLLRPDYSVDSLKTADENTILEVHNFQRLSWGETVNEVLIKYTDRFTGQSETVPAQDLANMQVQGYVVSHTNSYPGINDANLASRVAQRDLQTLSTPLSKVTLTTNRSFWSILPGDVFKLHWAQLGIDNLIMRVGQVDYGKLSEDRITITAVEDVFALPTASYLKHTHPAIVVPSTSPTPAIHQRFVESTFYEAVLARGTANIKALNPIAAYVVAIAARPSNVSASFMFETTGASLSGPFDNGLLIGYYSPSCTLPKLSREWVSTITYTDDSDFSLLHTGDFGYINDEMVSVVSFDTNSQTIVLNRGILDTVPSLHTAGSVLYITNKLRGYNTWEYASGETIEGYLLPQFPLGTLPVGSATPLSVSLKGRIGLPYPPGRLTLNRTPFPESLPISETLVICWANRDKDQQTAGIVLQSEGSVWGPNNIIYVVMITNSQLGLLVNEELTPGASGNILTYSYDLSSYVAMIPSVNAAATAAYEKAIEEAAKAGKSEADIIAARSLAFDEAVNTATLLYKNTTMTVTVGARLTDTENVYDSYQKATAVYTLV